MRTLFLAAVAMFGGAAWADEPKPVSDRAKQQVAEELVDKLGSRDFKERDEAEKKLAAMGRVVADVVKRGMKSESAEVATRCGRVLVAIRRDGLLATDSAEWQRFSKITGNTVGAKALFAEMADVPEVAEWLEQIEADPKAAEGAYRWAVDEADRRAVPPEGGLPRYLSSDYRPHLTLLLYAGGFEAAAKVAGPTRNPDAKELEPVFFAILFPLTQPGMRLRNQRTAPVAEVQSAAAGKRELFVRWLVAQKREPMLAAGVGIAGQCKAAEVLPTLLRLAKDKTASAALRVRCAGVAAAFDADPVPLLEPLLSETAEYTRVPNPKGGQAAPVVVQVRDIAAGLTVRAKGFHPADFGFVSYQHFRDPIPSQEPLQWGQWPAGLARFGFAADADRERAHATVAGLLAMKPLPTPTRFGKVLAPPDAPPELLEALADFERRVRADKPTRNDKQFWEDFDRLGKLYPRHTDRLAYERVQLLMDYPKQYGPVEIVAINYLPTATEPLYRVSVRRRLAEMNKVGSGRWIAAGHLLDAYAELLKVELPAKRPDIPTATLPGAKAMAKERAEYVIANTARREAQYVCDLMDARDEVVKQLREMFKDDPEDVKPLAGKKLSKDGVEALMKALK